jgi:hypothetical protein
VADSLNQEIADRLVQRQLRALRVETSLRRELFEALAVLEFDILALIKSRDPTQFSLLSRRRREVETLMSEEVDPAIQLRYERLARLLDTAMLCLAKHEAGAVATILNDVAAEPVIEEQPSERQLRAGVINGLFPSPSRPVDPSTTANDWWTRASESVSQKVRDTLIVGVALGENLVELSRRIHGTAENGFTDGVLSRAKTDAARLLTTQVSNALAEARAAVAVANPTRLIQVHTSILDSRTSLVCLGRNGLKYTADEEHTPIGHAVPYLSGIPYHPS